ncbi:SUMF1/EgtB/PvdO family nonheme iron enzyme [Accumulibacter sp.]|uniref:SUMF1/EgtB/PvdO family nonheme iron enzyme n=1 Tax=Accumulibacter sp. TaxID=2053492 RepID=UPI002C726766|nr:SUMF1/EgtB/PvdO family nonheme iron enzyme [Accumulibacter sp.]HNH91585.1 SUMF1/EgtB/PvdO family nonheme iron enzyme [Accumulibacter sp.]
MNTLRWLILTCCTLIAGCALPASLSAAEQRVALVVGNSAYRSSPLRNPGNDARAIAAKLRKLGFAVIERENLQTRQIAPMLREFRSRLRAGDVALFFYAGHGLQVRGINYLPTVDADITSEDDVPLNSINVSQVLEIMEEAKTRLNLMFLDACRNNPFTRRFRSAAGGLARVDAPSGTLISFATRPGSVAADGDGEHGLYTYHLLRQIEVAGQPIEQSLKRVVAGVRKDSGGQQEPWMEGSIDGDFFFVGTSAGTGAADSGAGQSAAGFEISFWDSIKNSDSVDDFRAYLEKFPQGQFRPLAEGRLRRLTQAAASSSAPAAAGERAAATLRDCADCPELVLVPAGSFLMGAPTREAGSGDNERPRHTVTLARPLAVGRFEITRGEYAAFVQASGYRGEAACHVWVGNEWVNQVGRSWRDPGFRQTDDHPVVCVNWHDARAYVAWLAMKTGKAYRLLSESEWEYAARGGTRTSRYWGDDPALACEYANVHDGDAQEQRRFNWEAHDCRDGFVETAPVGRFKANAFALHDLLGNVWEWVQDCQSVNYIGAPGDGSPREHDNCPQRVYRGGGWSGPASVRAAVRNSNAAGYRSQLLGFRVVRPAP